MEKEDQLGSIGGQERHARAGCGAVTQQNSRPAGQLLVKLLVRPSSLATLQGQSLPSQTRPVADRAVDFHARPQLGDNPSPGSSGNRICPCRGGHGSVPVSSSKSCPTASPDAHSAFGTAAAKCAAPTRATTPSSELVT